MVMWPELAPQGARLDIATEKGVVRVDASDGDFRVDTPTRGVWEIGASRAGLRGVVRLAHEELSLWPSRTQEAALHDALIRCLRSKGVDAPAAADDVVRDVDAVRRTPLLHSRELRTAPHLLSDAARFRACRVAIAMIEEEEDDDATPERVEALVARLTSWRDLFAHEATTTKKATRAVNATLADHGDALPHEALWGLRRVPLTRRAASFAHAELLGLLGAHPRALRLRAHMAIVETCPVDELAEIIARAPNDARAALLHHDERGVAILAELLASVAVPVSSRVPRVRDLYGGALMLALEQVPASTKTALPPIPLPAVRGIHFLRYVSDLVDEGRRMNHCVATRRGAAVAGECFIFAVNDDSGGFATVQVDTEGRVVEARGPKNRDNSTATWARRALTRWGRGFWAVRLGMSAKTFHQSVLPPHSAPLAHVEDAYRVYARASHEVPDDDGALAQWFVEYASRAIRGELSLATDSRPSPRPFAVALSPAGDVLSTSDEVWRSRTHA